VSHARGRLTEYGRALLIARGLDGSGGGRGSGVSRPTVYKWLTRFRTEGVDGLVDRSSCPVRSPRRLSARSEQRILQLRRRRKLGPHRLGAIPGHATLDVLRGAPPPRVAAARLDGPAQW
jgi:leucine-zipper of insertion element IS481